MSHHRFLRAAGTPEIDANIRNPRIYCVNSCFLMLADLCSALVATERVPPALSVQKSMPYLAGKNDILTLDSWYHKYIMKN